MRPPEKCLKQAISGGFYYLYEKLKKVKIN